MLQTSKANGAFQGSSSKECAHICNNKYSKCSNNNSKTAMSTFSCIPAKLLRIDITLLLEYWDESKIQTLLFAIFFISTHFIMKRHCHHKMLSQKTCSSCKMSRDWDKSSLPVVLTGQTSSSSPSPEEDPLQHRLHCQISDCVQCRCDSGYNMATTRSASTSPSTEWKVWQGCCGEYDHHLHRRAGAAGISVNRPRYRHRSSSADYSTMSSCYKHPLSRSPFSIMSPKTSSSSTDEICQCCGHCEHCQYCCVCKLNTSSICNSDHVTPTSSPTVSSTHVCSCISKTLNLQPETSRNSTTIDTTASMTNPAHHHHHSTQCSCSRWTFTLAAIFQSFMSRFSGLAFLQFLFNFVWTIFIFKKKLKTQMCILFHKNAQRISVSKDDYLVRFRDK